MSASARVIEALLTSTRPVPAWTREDYEAVCEHCGTTIEAETGALLSIGRTQLPPEALAVLDGAQPTSDYWYWCAGQTVEAQDECDREAGAREDGEIEGSQLTEDEA